MQPLEQLQTEFLAMLQGSQNTPTFGCSHLQPSQSCRIYRRNYRENHVMALADTYERVKTLVGIDYFRELARRYLAAHPSQSGDLNQYGAHFADFLETLLPTAPGGESLPYLPDIARLDWARLQALLQPRGRSRCLEDFVTLSTTQQSASRISLSPDSTLVRSPYPISQLWLVATGQQNTADLQAGGECLLVCRTQNKVTMHTLDDLTVQLVQCWQRKTLSESLSALQHCLRAEHLAHVFSQMQPFACALELRIPQ